jgi:putative ABC transport system permease protein
MRDWRQFVRERLPELRLDGAREQEIVEELAQQLEQEYGTALDGGSSETEAELRAMAQFVDWDALGKDIAGAERPIAAHIPEPVRNAASEDRLRKRRGGDMLADLLQDARFGLRMLRKNPGFAAVAILTLALGIGANTAIFSVVNAVLLKGLPYKDPAKLVFVWSTFITQGIPESGSSFPDFQSMQEQNRSFSGMAASARATFNVAAANQEPARVNGAQITSELFPLLGVQPALGRTFVRDDEKWGQHRVAVLSYGMWQDKFGGDPKLVGRTMRVNGEEFTIVGVMPRGMPFFSDLPQANLFVPLAYAPKDEMASRDNHYLTLTARLKPGATAAQAQADMTLIMSRIEKDFPVNKGVGAEVSPLRDDLVGDARPALLVLLGAVGFVLLIACVNVANLMLARATAREQEFAVRSAMGATRTHLLVQLLVESSPIALLGCAGGILLAVWGIRILQPLIPSDLPRFNAIEVNGAVLAFTVAISLVTAVLFSLAPTLHAMKTDVQEALRELGRGGSDGRGRNKLRNALVVSEVALALLLLVGAGLLMRTFGALSRADAGFSPDHVLTMEIQITGDDGEGHENRTMQFFDALSERVRALPHVANAGVTTVLPLGVGYGWGKYVTVEGHPSPSSLEKVPIASFQLSSPGYLQGIGARLKDGRLFEKGDDAQAMKVAVVNEAFVRKFLGTENPIGRSIRMMPPLELLPQDQLAQLHGEYAPMRTIVGVIGDMKDTTLNAPATATVFAPYAQFRNEGFSSSMTLAVKTTGDPAALAGAVRDAVHSLRPDQPVANVSTMNDVVAKSLSQARFSVTLLGIFAVFALILSSVGIYGVMAYVVALRTRELGIRLAMGAQKSDLLGLVMRHGGILAAAGIVVGVGAGIGLMRLLRSMLFGVSSTDPVTFASVAILLMLVALAACYLPARRAMRVDPMVALRHE